MTEMSGAIVDRDKFAQARAELGTNFARILGYYREDGDKAIDQIEEAARARSAVALVRPAHTLKGESLQFGADPLAALALSIEMTARRAVEQQQYPLRIIEDIVKLRPLFEETCRFFERELVPASPVRRAVGGFGRKAAAR